MSLCVRILFLHRQLASAHINTLLNQSPSNNLISLSFSMPVFSANLFGLFFTRFLIFKIWIPDAERSTPNSPVVTKSALNAAPEVIAENQEPTEEEDKKNL